MAMLIDNEDYEAILVARTKSTAVADRRRIDREDFDYVADQLLGAASMTRKTKIDIGDLGGTLEDITIKGTALVLSSIAPTTMSKAGAAVQTLTLTGTGFSHGCVVKLGSVTVQSQYVSPTSMTAQITLASFAIAIHNVTVSDQYRTSATKPLDITA